ncbi:MAG: hypothetical protein HOQ12_07990 [Gemmatimonadaceae bacterium]|nr:hypothetical protein [Gemmatimonadaceae bacterium]NUQ94421.1 hypothetical protein [Gemmatimonadaceae bacterium]NUR19457.1 hypothetical protein [Gemmatimonadaceae bacterium]
MRTSPRSLSGLAAAAGCVLAVVACEVPTSLPIWDTVWQVPADSAEVSVASLLPSSVGIVDVGGGVQAFSLTLPAAVYSTTLGSVCPGCAAANGMRVPKPQFTMVDSTVIALPSDVASADIVGGTIDCTITNGFGFDPINPSATASGWMRISVLSGSTLLAKDSVPGTALTLPTNVARFRSIPVIGTPAAPVRIAGPLKVNITLFSPAGDSVTINTSERFSVNATANNFRVSQAAVAVPSKSIPAQSDTVDLSGIKDVAKGTINGGAFILTVRNPFTVQGTVNVDMTAPNGTHVTKALSLPVGGPTAPPATLRLPLTASEINGLVGQSNVQIALTGGVNAPGGPVTVMPTQKIIINTMVEVTITAGGK